MIAQWELKAMDDWRAAGGYIAAVLVAIVGGFWTWFSGRTKGTVDAQQVIQSGFTTLVEELQRERVQLMEVVAAQASEITKLRGEVRQLSQIIMSMERMMVKHGIQIESHSGD